MKKYWHIALMLFCVLMITSCKDDEDTLEVDEVWKAQNEEAFQAQVLVPGFEQLKSQSNAGFILYKVLKTGESKEPIYYTSKVKIYYKGTLIDGTVFDDRSFEVGAPYVGSDGKGAAVSGFVDGFSTALQNMHPGDRWEIWIPQQMAYGASGQKSSSGSVEIKPYTTLVFDLEVVEVMEE